MPLLDEKLLARVARFGNKYRRMKRWQKIVSALACVVVFCTTYALILPAITMEKTSYCGYEEHVHTDECYEVKLLCETASTTSIEHTHTESCYTKESTLVCTLEETEGHTHSDACIHTEQVLSCNTEESEGHTHSDACYENTEHYVCGLEEDPEHVHDDSCIQVESNLVCGQEESAGHTHTSECYIINESYVCGQEESEGHTHSEDCYVEESVLNCNLEEEVIEEHVHTAECYETVLVCAKEEHEHSLACYSDSTADVESAANWENTLPKELSGVWADDVIAVAKSQLGYEESTRNYIVTDEGKTKGYSRYGAWYGDPYGHWCAMFASFCLHYADVDTSLIPLDCSCQNWIETLSKENYDLYRTADTYTPVPGDLIFFDNDQTDNQVRSNHVGIVVELIAEDGENINQVKTIEGNASNMVKYCTYNLTDSHILGYAVLPENPEMVEEEVTDEAVLEEEQEAESDENTDELKTLTLEEDWITATATFTDGVLPEDAVINVAYVDENSDVLYENLEDYVSEQGKSVVNTYFLSVVFTDAEGNEIEPDGEVTIKFTFNNPIEAQPAVMALALTDDESEDDASTEWNLYYIDGENTVTDSQTSTTLETGENNTLQSVSTTYQSGMVYAVSATAEDGTEDDATEDDGTETDSYDPGVTLTGNWATDVVAIANSQSSYTETDGISKFDQWAGNDGTNNWNVNFVNYCLSYANVTKDVIPWDTSYDFNTWKSALEEKGVFKTYTQGAAKAGDIVFVQDWYSGQNLNVGIIVESSGDAYYIAFGDMDGNGYVIPREQFWSSWTSRILGYVSLSDELTVSAEGMSVTATYNSDAQIDGASLKVALVNENDNYNQLVKEKLVPTGSELREDYYLDVYFEDSDGNKVTPKGNVEIKIEFLSPLDSNKSTDEMSTSVKWKYGVITSDGIKETELQNAEINSENQLTSITFQYQDVDAIALAATQGTKAQLTATGEGFSVTATADATVLLSDTMELYIEVLEANEDWIAKLVEQYQTTGFLVADNRFFKIEIRDKETQEKVQFANDTEIDITLEFEPVLEVNLEGKEVVSAEWKWDTISTNESDVVIGSLSSSNEALITMTEKFELETLSFNYEDQEAFALTAVAVDPDYAIEKEAGTFDELKALIEEASNLKTVITITNDIDATECISIPSDKNIEIDLNGHVIKTSTTLFSVDGGTLKIIDSQKKDESVAAGGSNVTGNSASYNSSSKTLTYYVTESVVTNSEVGYTQETLYVHTVELTGIIDGAGSTGPVIQLNSGVLNFDSGAIVDSQNRAIAQKGGTLNLTGGYICGNTASSRDVGNGTTTWDDRLAGGAIYTTGTSTINLSGTVLAANSVTERGGAIAIESWEGAVLNITGGVISGNVCTSSVDTGKNDREIHVGGGGIFTDGNVTVNMSGGYITNNISKATGYFDGGGGIFISGNSVYSLNGGYVTGNYAESGGGGIRSDFWRHYTKFYLNGGFVSSNHANLAEGGGVSINWDGVAYISGGYVTNNSTSTTQHWGGGGLFVSNGAKMYVVHAVITENDAGGFGGGLAGCSTGRVFIVSNDGGAIYNNDAAGTTVTIGSEKAEDKIYGLYNPVFMACGFQDYFCALTSTVEGNMLGGGAANWVGSADEVPVSIGKGETLTSSYVMGLTSHPSTESINLALQAARATNGVYINNNTSHTHGGAILCNGYLVVGSTKSIEIGTSLELSAKKTLLNEKEEEVLLYETDTDGNISVKEFKFVITDEAGTVVSEGTNDKDGTITFTERLAFTKAGTFTYYIYEDVESNSEGYVMDTSQYKLLVTVAQESASFDNGITRDQYKITNIVVQKKNDGDWENFSTWNVEWKDEYEYSPVKMELTSGSTFTNYELNSGTTKVTVVKKWTGSTSENSVTVTLYQNGAAYTGEDASVVLNSGNNWTYTWDKLPVKDEDGNKYSYTVQETVPDGYSATYEIYNEVSSNSIWVPATAESLVVGTEYIIVSPDGNYALYLTPDHSDKHLTSADKVTVSKGKETVTVGGVEYTDYYAANTIAERNIYKVSTGTLNSGATGTLMLNKATGSGLLIEPVNGLNLKDGTAVSSGYVSSFYLSNGLLIGYEKWSLDTNHVICYDESNAKFEAISVDDANAAAQAVKLYVKVQGDSVLENETSVIITNTKTSDITYGLNITKVSDQTVGEDTSIPLAGATFNLKDKDGIALRFTKTADGVYVWYSGTVTEEMESITTTELVTNTRGKLAISGLPAGTYTLEETKAPEGYELAEAEEVVLGQSGDTTIELKIVDEKKTEGEYNLPETGGTGTSGYTAGGVLLILLAACMLFLKQKNQKKGGYYSNGS